MSDQASLDELVAKLRSANESLVVASVRAQDLQEEAEAVNHRQKEFLSMLAHELRNPLAPISIAAEMLERISGAHPQLPYIQQVISRQIMHMKRLLEDLLDASRVATGKINLIASPLLLHEVLQSAAEIAKPSLDARSQALVIDLPKLPIVVVGDAVRLAQVFSNLLLNASKYTPRPDPITVSARLVAGAVEVSVRDSGVGIDPHIQPYIFDLFTQAPRTLDRADGGLGIGLSMVRTLVQMHGGAVCVESAGEGRGSEFTVTLPTSADSVLAPAPASEVPAVVARACRILIIEDHVDGNEALNHFLSDEGHAVDSAFDGKQGLAMAIDGAYDVVFCDIGLPGLDGYEVMKQLREHNPLHLPYAVAMTGYDQDSYRDLARSSGFNQFLVKPVPLNEVLDIVATHSGVAHSF
jgi:CheY-like chemotaxis protein